ncbi:helix-turn-helix transcriptional regulator [Senegalimassilia faecalis]|uniref:response regulator transcription factor n=1 Tax=Senegalimassilia faecalis TaxID=2509433 RepID=UPI00307690C6
MNGSMAGGASVSGASGAAPRKAAKASVGGGDAAAGGAATWVTHGPVSQDAEGAPLVAAHDGGDAPSLCDPSNPVYGLSARELEILDLFAQGRSANWIAEHLTISKNTVRTHLRAIYSKLDVHSRQELLDLLAGNRAE